jgi:hypothetical protein
MLVRRMATVMISAPEASMASRVCGEVLVLAGADQQARAIALAGDDEGICVHELGS